MNPAPSVILFTVGSGAGYGLLAALGTLAALGLLPAGAGFAVLAFGLALALVTAGLLASTFHLGHPERAWRAFSQWRSSWLSREAVAAAATYPPAVALAGFAAGGGAGWVAAVLGVVTAVLAVTTVYCTGMIYRSLKPIHAWHNRYTVPGYLLIGAATGLVLCHAVLASFGSSLASGMGAAALAALAGGFLLKRSYWRFLDTTAGPATPESATGLGSLGRVRLLDPPHTGRNYVMREMGFVVARRHAAALRALALVAAFVAPAWAIAAGLVLGGGGGAALAAAAAVSALMGAVVERWLFFAEARHASMLYYGAAEA